MKKPTLHFLPPPPTAEKLARVALDYLSHYAASEMTLRQVLINRLRKASLRHPDFAADQAQQSQLRSVIETIIAKHKKTGTLNDMAFAETKVVGLRRAGHSRRAIQQRLARKGIGAEAVKKVLADSEGNLDPAEGEMKAAFAYAKRRRLGPFRAGTADTDRQRKDLASMARAGFPLDIARKVLGNKTGDDE